MKFEVLLTHRGVSQENQIDGQETHGGLQALGQSLGTVGVELALMAPCS